MNKQYLTLAQNTCAARIFLNTLGLSLETVNDINESSKLKIFDKTMKEVGELYFDNNEVIMLANYNNSELEAKFDMAKIFGFIDQESNNAIFGEWTSKIVFQINNTNNKKLSGHFLINSSVDSEFGVTCLCHPLIICETPEKETITLKMLRNGTTFYIKIDSKDYTETIDIRPWDPYTFILHEQKKEPYNEEKRSYPYRKYAEILNGKNIEENEDSFHVFLKETEYQTRLNYKNQFLPKIKYNNVRETFQQMGTLMRQIDPDMYTKIEEMRKILSIGDISLLDNLISVCYDSYTDEELYALLGIERQPMQYQNGADNLVDSYYGIDENNSFFPAKTQKKFIKNK